MRTVIISDTHVGSKESNYRELNRFLKHLDCDHLILAGDIWDLWEMEADELRKRHYDTVSHLKNLAKNGTSVEMLLGNHDESYLDDPVVPLSLVPVSESITIETSNGMKIAVLHGDKYDHFCTRFYWIYRIMAWANETSRKTIGISFKTFRKSCTSLKGKEYCDIVERIHNRVKEAYREMGFDAVIMGHTHSPKHEKGKIEFLNAGDWKFNNTYVRIDNDEISLNKFS